MEQLTLLGIFAAGLLTFASPCILPLVPLYVSLLAGSSVAELRAGARGRALAPAVAFALGLVMVFVGLGMAASVAGRWLLTRRALLLPVGGLLVFLFGLKLIGYLKIPWLERDVRPGLARLGAHQGVLGGFAFGAAFGLGWTPCIGPVLGTVLTYTASVQASPQRGALYLATYAAGIAAPLVLTAALAPRVLRWLPRLSQHLRRIEIATGVVLALMGLLIMTDRLTLLVPASAGASLASRCAPSAECVSAPEPIAELASAEPACEASESRGCTLPDVALDLAPAPERPSTPSGPRLVEFIARTCPICQRMEPVLLAAEQGCAGHGIQITRLDVGTPEGRSAADQHRVRGVPTFVFLDASGAEVARLVGEQSLAALEQSMQVVSGQACDNYRALP